MLRPFGADYHCETNYQKCSPRVKWVFRAECFTQVFSQLYDTCKLTCIEEIRHSNWYCLLSVSFSSIVSSWHLLCDGSALKSGLYLGGWCAREFPLWSTLSLWQMHPREIGWCPGALTCQRVCMRPVALETKVPQTDELKERWGGKQISTFLCICPLFHIHRSHTVSW